MRTRIRFGLIAVGLAVVMFPAARLERRLSGIGAAKTQHAAVAGFFNVREIGAKGDGKTLDTTAINKAIEAAAAAGGGTVFFPAGNYLSHSIHLKSDVALYLDQ